MSLIQIIILSILSFSISDDKLVFLMTHFRHGARAPQRYKNQSAHLDYILEHWNNPGELTGMGQRMHYALGLRNRKKYIEELKFLSENFNPHEILIYSSQINRTLLSAASQLQGWYPFGTGEILKNEQIEGALPQVDIPNDIKEKLKNLSNSALPGQMSLAPIRMINNNERKIIIYDIEQCKFRRTEMREENYKNVPTLKKFVEDFKNKYSTILNEMYQDNNTVYDIDFVDNFCDAFIAAFTEKKEMEKLNKTGIDQDILIQECFEFSGLNFRDWISGDKDRTLATLETSKLMREFIYYMKRRIDTDINKENIEEKLEDYSKPKMLMISGHDTTISALEMFFVKVFFNNNESYYIHPKFASQVAFEITTFDGDKKDENGTVIKKTYEDYYINYYFNDKLIFNYTVEEFIKKVEPALWSDSQIDTYCKFDQKEGGSDSTNDNKDDDDKNLYHSLTIAFSIISAVFLLIIIFLIVKANRSKTSQAIDKAGLLFKNYE